MFGLTLQLPSWFRPIELIYHAMLYGLMVVGAWRAFRARQWELLLITGVPILYITGLTLISQTSAMDTRMRTPITAPIAILVGYGVAMLRSGRGIPETTSEQGMRSSPIT